MDKNGLGLLLTSMGDFIHGITGDHNVVSKLDDKLQYNWKLVSQMALCMREYDLEREKYTAKNTDFDKLSLWFPEEEALVEFLFLYMDKQYSHSQFIELCGQLVQGISVQESLNFATKQCF